MQQSLLPPDIEDQIPHLHRLIDTYPFPHTQAQPQQEAGASDRLPRVHDYREDYKHCLKFFEHSIRQLQLAGPHVEMGMVLIWAYSLSKEVRDDLEAYHPAGLVLLAHWCVLLHVVDDAWFMKGISCQLMQEIESKIHPSFREWLIWPRKWVSRN